MSTTKGAMSTSDEIAARVQRFVAELQSLVLQEALGAVRDAVGQALGEAAAAFTLAASAAARAAEPAPPASPRVRRRPNATSAPAAKNGAAAEAATVGARRGRRAPKREAARRGEGAPGRGAQVKVRRAKAAGPDLPRDAPAQKPPPAATGAASELEAQVLAAVADLVRAGVEDVVQLSGLSAVSATITLRALAARGKLIRAETPGGVEYSLP